MKFGETLRQRICPEWRNYYVSYHQLKRLLTRFEIEASNARQKLCVDANHDHDEHEHDSDLEDMDNEHLSEVMSRSSSTPSSMHLGSKISHQIPDTMIALPSSLTFGFGSSPYSTVCSADRSISELLESIEKEFSEIIDKDLLKINDMVRSELVLLRKHVSSLVEYAHRRGGTDSVFDTEADVGFSPDIGSKALGDYKELTQPLSSDACHPHSHDEAKRLSQLRALHLQLNRLRGLIFINADACKKITKKLDKVATRRLGRKDVSLRPLQLPILTDRLYYENFNSTDNKAEILSMIAALEEVAPAAESARLIRISRKFTYGVLDQHGLTIMDDFDKVKDSVDKSIQHREQRDRASSMIVSTLNTVYGYRSLVFITLASLIATIILVMPKGVMFKTGQNLQQRCFALLVFTIILWVTEALPFFVTSLFIPVLVVLLKIIPDTSACPTHSPSSPSTSPCYPPSLDAKDAAQLVMSKMFDHVLVLVLGGFAISAVLRYCQVELFIASKLQRWLGHKPKLFLLSVMFLGLLLSMAVSNVTAPVLVLSIILPVIRDGPTQSKYARALLLGLAFSCNLGGMITPVSSPQNVVSLSALNSASNGTLTLGYAQWVAVSLPIAVLANLVIFGFILLIVNPDDVTVINPIVYQHKRVSMKGRLVLLCAAITIVLWSTLSLTEDFFGDMGIPALIFIVIAFGSKFLSKEDFNSSMRFDMIFLIAGGNCLSLAAKESGLLDVIAGALITTKLSQSSSLMDVYIVTLQLASLIVFVSTFVSHTVASLILMPLATQIAFKSSSSCCLAMTMTCCFSCSAAMIIPMTSFPNVNSLLAEDDYGTPYLRVIDFIINGSIGSAVATIFVLTLGFWTAAAVFGAPGNNVPIPTHSVPY